MHTVGGGGAAAPAAAPSFERVSLWEQVYDHVRGEILANRLSPGAALNEAALAASLGVSRGPVREAIKHLAAEGLVEMRSRRPPVVSSLTHEEFLQAYQVREALEVLAVRLATPRLSAEQIEALAARHGRMAELVEENAVAAFFEENARFHLALVEASGNRKLAELYRQLMGQMGRYRLQSLELRGSMKRSVSEHGALVRALRRRDADRAAKLLAEHIRVPQRRLEGPR